jgi:hypothetical protein
MYKMRLSILVMGIGLLLMASPVLAQEMGFADPHVDYSFSLPEAKWKQVGKPTAISPNVEYVYGDRRDGLLEVRRMTVSKDSLTTDIIRDEETKLQFLPGYVAGKEENFVGRLKGAVFNFEYVYSGRAWGGRYYFLRPNETTVYVLRFSGGKDSLRSLRNQTDQIARTFAIKAG